MFFQADQDDDNKELENRIIRAIETGFKNVQLKSGDDRSNKRTTNTDDDWGRTRDRRVTVTGDFNLFSPEDWNKKIGAAVKNTVDAFKNPFDTLSAEVEELQKGTRGVMEQFGRGREISHGIAQALGEARFSIMEMGGSAVDAYKAFEDIIDATDKTSLSTARYADELYAMSSVLGRDIGTIASQFDDAGFSMSKVEKTMMGVVDYAASVGLNVEEVSGTVLKNLDKINLYNFQNGVQGMARMAAHATMMKVDMGKTLALADELLSPEKAIEMAAGLQRLGVSTSALIDPLRLMDMAQNDPEALQKEIINLTKQYTYFNEETKKTEILPGAQRYLRELAPMLGMTKEDLATMAVQSGNIQRKLSEIRMPNIVQSEEQKMMIANLAELNDKGEYEIKYLDENQQEQTALLSELNSTTLKQIEESQKVTSMDPKQLALKQLSAAEETNLLLVSLGARLPKEIASTRSGYEAVETAGTVGRTFARGTYDATRETLGITPETIKNLDNELNNVVVAFKKNGGTLQDLQNLLQAKYDEFKQSGEEKLKGLEKEDGTGLDMDKVINLVTGTVAGAASTAMGSFKNAAETELKNTSSTWSKAMLEAFVEQLEKGQLKLDMLRPTTGLGTTTGTTTTSTMSTNATTNVSPQETQDNVNNVLNVGSNLRAEDATIVNNIVLDEKDTVVATDTGVAAGTDLMGLKTQFDDASGIFSKHLINAVDNMRKGFESILKDSPNLSPIKEEKKITTISESKLLSDNFNVTINPELAPEFAKIYKEVRDIGQSIPLNFSFEEPKFVFKFNTDENIDSYLDFKKI